MRFVIAFLILVASTPFALANEIVRGTAAVVDGDTLEIGERQVRLLGIDAAEGAQELPIASGGTDFLGRGAAMMLRALITENTIRCELSDYRDVRGLPLARCFNGSVDLGAEMIASGMAWAVPDDPSPYREAAARAKAERKGFWRDTAREGSPCTVKGVVDGTRKTLITPWSPWYRDVDVVEARGDRWFCSEAEAVAEGWRAPLWLMGSVVSGIYNPKR